MAVDWFSSLPRRAVESRAVADRNASSSTSLLLTPHAGELAHLRGRDKATILEAPEDAFSTPHDDGTP